MRRGTGEHPRGESYAKGQRDARFRVAPPRKRPERGLRTPGRPGPEGRAGGGGGRGGGRVWAAWRARDRKGKWWCAERLEDSSGGNRHGRRGSQERSAWR